MLAKAAPGFPPQRYGGCLILAHRSPAEFDRRKALVYPAARDVVSCLRRIAEQDRRISPQFCAECTAQQAINWLAERLARNIPQGNVDAADSLLCRASPSNKD